MTVKAHFWYEIPMSEEAHAKRDALLEDYNKVEKKPGISIHADLLCEPTFKFLTEELEKKFKQGEEKLVSIAKKAGLKPAGRPDVSYGIHGGTAGPITMNFSLRAND